MVSGAHTHAWASMTARQQGTAPCESSQHLADGPPSAHCPMSPQPVSVCALIIPQSPQRRRGAQSAPAWAPSPQHWQRQQHLTAVTPAAMMGPAAAAVARVGPAMDLAGGRQRWAVWSSASMSLAACALRRRGTQAATAATVGFTRTHTSNALADEPCNTRPHASIMVQHSSRVPHGPEWHRERGLGMVT